MLWYIIIIIEFDLHLKLFNKNISATIYQDKLAIKCRIQLFKEVIFGVLRGPNSFLWDLWVFSETPGGTHKNAHELGTEE